MEVVMFEGVLHGSRNRQSVDRRNDEHTDFFPRNGDELVALEQSSRQLPSDLPQGARGAESAVVALEMRVEPARAHVVQHGLFLPQGPEPDQLEVPAIRSISPHLWRDSLQTGQQP